MKRSSRRVHCGEAKLRVYAVLSSSKPRVVYEVHPSREQAEHGAHMSYWGRRSHPVEAISVAAASVVHRLVFVDWDGYATLLKQISTAKAGIDGDPFGDTVDWVVRATGLKRTVLKRDTWRYLANPAAFTAPPRHLVDVPEVLVGGPEYVGDEMELASRDQALVQAARENRKRRARYGGGNWAVVVELGGVVPGSLHTNTQFAGDVGVQAERRSVAVRVVRPTPDEVKRFGGPVRTRMRSVAVR